MHPAATTAASGVHHGSRLAPMWGAARDAGGIPPAAGSPAGAAAVTPSPRRRAEHVGLRLCTPPVHACAAATIRSRCIVLQFRHRRACSIRKGSSLTLAARSSDPGLCLACRPRDTSVANIYGRTCARKSRWSYRAYISRTTSHFVMCVRSPASHPQGRTGGAADPSGACPQQGTPRCHLRPCPRSRSPPTHKHTPCGPGPRL